MSKLPKILLWVLFAVSLVVAALFLAGGTTPVTYNNAAFDEPKQTNILIVWAYILFAVALLSIIAVSLLKFVTTFISNPKKGLSTLLVIITFLAVFVISWLLSTGELLPITGYAGEDNVGNWARFAETCVIASYILAASTILTLVGSIVYSLVKK
jgi:hypothetical protein